MPLVVPELKTITLGGAVAGVGIESTSFRNGFPHESVVEMDVLTGDGRVVTASPTNEHADLFRAFPNSYGTLGYALRLRIELERVHPYVTLTHHRFSRLPRTSLPRSRLPCRSGPMPGRPSTSWTARSSVRAELYLTVGTWAQHVPALSDYTGNQIYYRSIQSKAVDHLTVRDYLWRWDTDWFWCSRAMYVQKPWVRPLVPKRFLRSDVYWKVIGFERRHQWKARLDQRRGHAAAGARHPGRRGPRRPPAGVPRLLPPRGGYQPRMDLPDEAARGVPGVDPVRGRPRGHLDQCRLLVGGGPARG